MFWTPQRTIPGTVPLFELCDSSFKFARITAPRVLDAGGYRQWLSQHCCVFVTSFSEDGVEIADTAYALALAYTNVQDDDAESMSVSYFFSATTSHPF